MLKTIVVLCLLSVCHGYTGLREPWYTLPVTVETFSPCPEYPTGAISLTPSETDCSVFYICFGGYWVQQQCDSGKEFDPEIQGCTETSSTSCSSKAFSCPGNSSMVTQHASLYDCKKFHVCFQGNFTTYNCVKDYEYDEDEQKCVPISEYGCTANNTAIPPFSCPINSTAITMYPDDTLCDKFYICFEGNVSEFKCEPDYEFDGTVKDCVPISGWGCTAYKTSTTEAPTTRPPRPDFVCPTEDHKVTVYADEEDCAVFNMCFAGISHQFICQEDFEFNSTLMGCSPVSRNGCTDWKTSTPTEGSTGGIWTVVFFQCPNNDYTTSFYPDHYNCVKYYSCSAGTYQELFCERGFEFNPTLESCYPIAQGGCTDLQLNGGSSTKAVHYLN